jgi:glycosyltransferase involved in cell wall biosynthesis
MQQTESHPDGFRFQFSVIIPTFNWPHWLRECLSSISRLNYSRDHFEVIVIDDGSTKPIENIIQEFSPRFNIKCFRIQNSGPAAARNKGAEIARGLYYAFIDDDCRLACDWLDRTEKRLRHSPASLIGGRVLNRLSDNIYATTSQMVLDAAYAFHKREFGCPQFFTTNNLAVPAVLFEDIGGFDARLRTAEDRDFCDRCLQRGYQLVYDPAVLALLIVWEFASTAGVTYEIYRNQESM